MTGLYLIIPGAGKRKPSAYRVEILQGSVRLTGSRGAVYDCRLVNGRGECTCGDWEFRRKNAPDSCCKHLCALREAGLL